MRVVTGSLIVVGLGAVMAGVVMFFTPSHHQTQTQTLPPHRVFQTRVSSGTFAKLVPLAPGRLWYFTPVPTGADQTILSISNPGRTAAMVRIRTLGAGSPPPQQLSVPASGEIEMILPPSSLHRALRVRASAPILPLRLVMRKGKVASWPGVRLAGT